MPSASTPVSTPDMQPQTVDNSMFIIIGAAICAGFLVIVLVIIIVIVVIVFVVRAKGALDHSLRLSEPTYDLPADYEKPLAPPVETIPPRMEMKENIAYEQIKSFDMISNSA